MKARSQVRGLQEERMVEEDHSRAFLSDRQRVEEPGVQRVGTAKVCKKTVLSKLHRN